MLDRGRLGARDVLREGDNEKSSYVFKTGYEAEPVLPESPMADGVFLKVPIEDETASIILGDRHGDDHELIIDPKDASSVTVRVYNQELEDILGFPTAPVPAKLGDIDFATFYLMSSGWADLAGQPLPIPFRVSTGGGGKNRPCRNPQYDGVTYP